MQISLHQYSKFSIRISNLRLKLRKIVLFLQSRYQIKVGRISICLFRPIQMRDLMRRFKPGEEQISDILSFVEDEFCITINGDIAICVDRVHKDAKQDGVDFGMYLREIILHGILHLFGLTHGYTQEELEQVRKLHRTIECLVFDEKELDLV